MASAQQDRGLVHELQRSHRFTIWVLGGMLILSLVTSGYLIFVSQTQLTRDIALTGTVRDAREAMIDQETGLRGWLSTGDEVFLEPYERGRQVAERKFRELGEEAQRAPELTQSIGDLLVARERFDTWAAQAARTRVGNREREQAELSAFLLRGKNIFDGYRAADRISTLEIQTRRDADARAQQIALSVVFLLYLVVLAATGALTLRRRRRLQSSILVPIDLLLGTIGALHAGDLTGRTQTSGVPELDQIGAEVNRLAGELQQANADAADREARLTLLAQRFETVVRIGREITGSLSISYVSRSVTTAAADLLGTPSTLWVRGRDGDLLASDRSQDVHGAVPPDDEQPSTAVVRAAAEARSVCVESRLAYPLVLAGKVVAVLDADSTAVDEDTELVLTALLATAAAALESAHLHKAARELADTDGLTHLANRRRFEVDMNNEWERCRRYGRPMSIVMLDLDHFKRLNDEHGHLLGDQVLREASSVVAAALRPTDDAYRYGGEEIVVLLRETGLAEAVIVAERLRVAVAAVHLEGYQVSVTTSAGVAARQESMTNYTALIAVADGALYSAKRGGRNRVVADPDAQAQPGPAPRGDGAETSAVGR